MRQPILPGEARPLLFAHRGISSVAPENTMAAFRLARDLGIPGVELDIHLTKDGKLAVIHDHFTGRTAGAGRHAPGPEAKGLGHEIERLAWSELSGLDVGAWKGERYAGERIPLLGDLFEEFGEKFYYDIEIKNGRGTDYGLEEAFAKCIREARGGKGMLERCVVSSFNPLALARFKARMPKVPTAIIWSDDENLPRYLRNGLGRWFSNADYLKPAKEKVHRLSSFGWRKVEGYAFVPWTVDEPAEARRLLDLGCAGLISNRPHQLELEKRDNP